MELESEEAQANPEHKRLVQMKAVDGKDLNCSRQPIQPCGPLLSAQFCGVVLTRDLKRLISSSGSVLLSKAGALTPRHAHSFYLSLGLQDLITAHKMAF